MANKMKRRACIIASSDRKWNVGNGVVVGESRGSARCPGREGATDHDPKSNAIPDRQTDRLADRQADRQTEIETDRQTDRQRQAEIDIKTY